MAGTGLSGDYTVFFRAPERLVLLSFAILLLTISACFTGRTVFLGQQTKKYSLIPGRTG
jgi:hypothetical protein